MKVMDLKLVKQPFLYKFAISKCFKQISNDLAFCCCLQKGTFLFCLKLCGESRCHYSAELQTTQQPLTTSKYSIEFT